MQELWERKRLHPERNRLELEIRHAARPGAPFVKIGSVTCAVDEWPTLKKYLLDTDREVVEE